MPYTITETLILSRKLPAGFRDNNRLLPTSIAPLCYGAAMFLCALTEKLLRTFYIYLMRDRV